MAKALKIIIGLVVALVLIVAVGMAALLIFVDPNDYRGQIETAVKDQTGRTLAIEGDIRLSVFPWLGLELGRVRLGNAPGFGDTPFAEVGEAQVRAKLLPLLHKQLEVGKLTLRGLRLDLQVDKSGRSNWADLAGGGKAAPAPSTKSPAAPMTGGPALASLAIGGLEVSDAQLSFRDANTGAAYAVRNLSLTSGPIALGRPTDVKLGFTAEANQPQVAANVEFASRITVAPSLQQFTLAGTRLKVNGKGAVLPVPELAAQLDGDIALDLADDTVTVGKLELQSLGVKLLGEVRGNGLTKTPHFTGHLRLEPFNPRDLLTRLGQAAPETADKGVLGKVTLDTAFEATTNSAKLSDFKLLLDDTALTGTLAVEDIAKQALRFDLTVDGINLDRYLPPPSQNPPPPPSAGSAAVGTAQLPMDLLRALDVIGTLHIGKLTASNLHSEDVRITVNAKSGKIRVHPATAKLYGGGYSGDIGLDATGKEPVYSMNEKLDQVQVGPLLKDLMGDDKLHGTANLQAKLTARGAAPPTIRQTLSGTASFAFTDGMVKGINIAQQLRDALARFKGEKPPKSDEPNATDFSALGGSFTIKNGVVDNRDLDAKSPLLRVQGAGTADIAKETLNYRLKVAVVGTLSGQGGQALQDLKGLVIPLRIHGPFSDLGMRVDLKEVLTAKQKAKLEAGKAEMKAKEEAAKAALKAKEEAAKAALKAKEEAAKKAQRKKLEAKKKKLQEQLEEKLKNLRK